MHGKNQHKDGNFGDHVLSLKMRVADGRVVDCSADRHPDLFAATIGGMGLTGHILEVEFGLDRIPSQWIWQESRRVHDIDEFQDALENAAPEWPYTMGWIDGLARGDRDGSRHPDDRPLGRAGRGAFHPAQAPLSTEAAVRLARVGAERADDSALQRALLPQAVARVARVAW